MPQQLLAHGDAEVHVPVLDVNRLLIHRHVRGPSFKRLLVPKDIRVRIRTHAHKPSCHRGHVHTLEQTVNRGRGRLRVPMARLVNARHCGHKRVRVRAYEQALARA